MGMTLPALTPAQESLFLTLGGKAIDSRQPRPFLGDAMADEVLARTGYDIHRFAGLRTGKHDVQTKTFDIAVRSKRLDEVARRFVAHHPDAVVLDLGVGLDTRVFRVDPPSSVDWYDVDLPEVVELRRQVVPPRDGAHVLAADVSDPHWLDAVPGDRPVLVVADGLVAFLSADGLASLLLGITSHFPTGEVAFNAYTKLAVWAVKHARIDPLLEAGMVNPGFNDPRMPERWIPGLRLVEEIFLARAPEIAQFPRPHRLLFRLLTPNAWVARMLSTTLLHYRF